MIRRSTDPRFLGPEIPPDPGLALYPDLWRDLKFFVPFVTLGTRQRAYDVVRRKDTGNVGTLTPTRQDGFGLSYNYPGSGAQSDYLTLADELSYRLAPSMTIAALVWMDTIPTSSNRSRTITSKGHSGSDADANNHNWLLCYDRNAFQALDGWCILFEQAGGANHQVAVEDSTSTATGKPVMVVGVKNDLTNQILAYANGKSNSDTSSAAPITNSRNIGIGTFAADASSASHEDWDGSIRWVAGWNRALRPSEVDLFMQDWFALYRRRPDLFFIPAAAVGGAIKNITATIAGTGALNATVETLVSLPATIAGTGALNASVTRVRAVPATITGTGALAAAVTAVHDISATIAGTGALNATITVVAAGVKLVPATIAGTGALNTTVETIVSVPATIAGAGSLAAILTAVHDISATIAGTGALNASIGLSQQLVSATITGTGALSAAAGIVGEFDPNVKDIWRVPSPSGSDFRIPSSSSTYKIPGA